MSRLPHKSLITVTPVSETSPDSSDGRALGHFYLIQCDPAENPGHYKVGFTEDLAQTLHALQPATAGYFFRAWVCYRECEKLAVDYITATSENLGEGLYRSPDSRSKDGDGGSGGGQRLLDVRDRCERFFSVLTAVDGELNSVVTAAPDIRQQADDEVCPSF